MRCPRFVHSMLLFKHRSSGHSTFIILRGMREVVSKYSSCKNEVIPCESATPYALTHQAKRLDVDNLVHPVIDERLVKERHRLVASNDQIWLLERVSPARVLVEGFFHPEQNAVNIGPRHVVLCEITIEKGT